jgi:hypothetical protein
MLLLAWNLVKDFMFVACLQKGAVGVNIHKMSRLDDRNRADKSWVAKILSFS